MRAIIQRVTSASVEIDSMVIGEIGQGLMILLGVEEGDGDEDKLWLAKKIAQMRIFQDEEGRMNRSLLDMNGEALVISQFTLHASTKKGNRPSFLKAAKPEHSEPLYHSFCDELSELIGKAVAVGKFGAMMDISLVNNGPVTILIDSRNRE